MEKMRCKKCGSSQIYYRRITNDYACQKCGEVMKEFLTDKEAEEILKRKPYNDTTEKGGNV